MSSRGAGLGILGCQEGPQKIDWAGSVDQIISANANQICIYEDMSV